MVTILLIILAIVQAYVIAYMAWDHSYGCFTRAAFNLMYPVLKVLGYTFIAGDIDNFKGANTKYDYEVVNRMVYSSIRTFFSLGRIGDMVFRIYSGDEFFIATKSKDVDALITRVQKSFATQGFTIKLFVFKGAIDTSNLKMLSNKKGG